MIFHMNIAGDRIFLLVFILVTLTISKIGHYQEDLYFINLFVSILFRLNQNSEKSKIRPQTACKKILLSLSTSNMISEGKMTTFN